MNEADQISKEIAERLMQTDYFSQWMGIEIIEVREHYSKVKMTLRKEMMNGFGIAHGGISFSLADSAFAYACNSDGKITVALDVSISFPKAAKEGDLLTAEAKQVSSTRRTALYLIEVRDQHHHLVALFKGTCYKTLKPLFE